MSAPTPGPVDEEQERRHLADTVQQLRAELAEADAQIAATSDDLENQKQFLWEHRRDMDGSEKAAFRGLVDVSVTHGEHVARRRHELERLIASPYFGRVDFRPDPRADSTQAIYIGTHGFRDPHTRSLRIHDWRAPVSSLYYDYETGPAQFVSPEGEVHGDITRKLQYKTRGDHLEYMLESAVNIGDDLLQRELSATADDKMRNIVATIQREQNAVIRNETADVLILQGVAGSGKTSIALHRVAFLLYRFADTLTADDVLILSPNRVFGDYIANVLPELGEENVPQARIEDLATRLLDSKLTWQTFQQQVTALLETADPGAAERIRFKATLDFVTELETWITQAPNAFTPAPISTGGESLEEEWVADAFAALGPLPLFTRLQRLTEAAVTALKQRATTTHRPWRASAITEVRRQVRAMLPWADARGLYEHFYPATGRGDLYRTIKRNTLEFADVFPLLYTTLRTGRVAHDYADVRHLLIDEMQDYTPVQYAVIRLLFPCRMTILGDANQSVNPLSSSTVDTIRAVFPGAETLELLRSYRSTRDIAEFALSIAPNDRLIPVDRRGPAPTVTRNDTPATQAAHLRDRIKAAQARYESVGVIAKTEHHAQALHADLAAIPGVAMLTADATEFGGGITIASAQMAKGLEFDVVLVPDVDSTIYSTAMDRSLLYIACTRAMHELHLSYVGDASAFLP